MKILALLILTMTSFAHAGPAVTDEEHHHAPQQLTIGGQHWEKEYSSAELRGLAIRVKGQLQQGKMNCLSGENEIRDKVNYYASTNVSDQQLYRLESSSQERYMIKIESEKFMFFYKDEDSEKIINIIITTGGAPTGNCYLKDGDE